MSANTTTREFTGRHMLAVLLAFFGVVIAVNVALAVFAARSWTGLVVANSYVASQHYNEMIVERRRGEALGWRVGVSPRAGHLELRVRDASAQPLTGATIGIAAGHPADEGEDRRLAAVPVGRGAYRTAAALPAGVWNLDINVSRGSQAMTERVRLVVPPGPE